MDRLRGVPPPQRPAGRRGWALGNEPARRAAGRGPEPAGPRGEEPGDRGDPDLALGGPGDDRHVGPEARRPRGDPRRVPPDRDVGAGGLHLRAHAGAGEGHGPLPAGPFARPLDQRAWSGHDLHGHGEPAAAVARVPRGWGAGRAAAFAARRHPALRHFRCTQGRRPGHRSGLPRPGVRPVRRRGRPAQGDAPVPRGVAPLGIHVARPAVPRGLEKPVRPRPARSTPRR